MREGKNKSYYFLINSLNIGGAERVVVNLSHALVEKGYTVTVITLTKVVTYSLDERVRHIALSTRNEDSIWSLVLLYPYYRVRLLLHFFNNTYDGGMSLLEPANILHILTKKHAVVSFRTSFAHFKGVFGRIYLFFVLKFYKYARKIIVNSEENKWRMSKKGGYVTGKVKVLYNMLDIESIYKLKQEPLPNTIAKKIHNKKVFITVGRLVAAKRHYDILAGLEAWHEKYQKDFVYIIIGDGPERENLARFIYTLKIADKIILTGNVRNVFSYLSQSDVFLFASEYEGFPNVLLESSAVGIPIITTDFSTGARERMLGKYDDKNLMYPFKTFLGYILSPNIVVTEFVDCLEAVENMTIPDADLTQHTPESVITQLENIILNP